MDQHIQRIFGDGSKPLSNRVMAITAQLEKLTRSRGSLDCSKEPLRACQEYRDAALTLNRYNLGASAMQLLLEAWESFGARQHSRKNRIYRALLAQTIAEIHLELGERGQASRWMLTAFADDVLGGNASGDCSEILRLVLGFSSTQLENAATVARKCLEGAERGNWRTPCSYAEEVIRRIYEDTADYGISRHLISNTEFPVCRIYLGVLLEQMRRAKTNREKGRSLEELAVYLVSLLPGCVTLGRVLREDQVFETDIVCRNMSDSGSAALDLFGRSYLVECKNWRNKVDVQHLGYFLFRVRLTHCHFGLLFSPKGISGNSSKNAASKLLDLAFHQDKTTCVVVDQAMLNRLRDDRSSNFFNLVTDKVARDRFGSSRNT